MTRDENGFKPLLCAIVGNAKDAFHDNSLSIVTATKTTVRAQAHPLYHIPFQLQHLISARLRQDHSSRTV